MYVRKLDRWDHERYPIAERRFVAGDRGIVEEKLTDDEVERERARAQAVAIENAEYKVGELVWYKTPGHPARLAHIMKVVPCHDGDGCWYHFSTNEDDRALWCNITRPEN